ncbi:MAG: PP2C family protein-serine/threonine phosphatase [Desulfovibrionaceae bacterium]
MNDLETCKSDLQELEKAAKQLQRLRECFSHCQLIAASQTLEQILDNLVDNVMQNLGAQNASLYLVDQRGEELLLSLSKGPIGSRLPPGLRLKKGQGLPGRVFASGRTERVEDASTIDPAKDLLVDTAPGEAVTALCIPLTFKGQVLGVAKLTNKADGTRFDADDQEIFEYACAQAALAIHQSYVREMEVDRERMELQLEKAAQVQRVLLPESAPEAPGFEISAGSVSCDEIGGDYLDFLSDPETLPGVLGLAVGDVVGHGVPAALLMATLRAYMRANVRLLRSPDLLVQEVNGLFTRDTFKEAHFCTLFLLVIDTTKRRLEWVNAGHDPALSYSPRTREFTELSGAGFALGCDEHACFQEFDHQGCDPGQICLLATDGVWETFNSKGEMYGKDRARALIERCAGESAEDIRLRLMDDLVRFRQGERQRDDVTIAVVKAL